MTTSRHIQTPRRPWTPAEELVLRDLYPDVPCADIAALLGRLPGSIYDHAQRAGLEKSAYFWASDATGRIQRGKTLPAMIATRFKPGSTPWNKGVSYQAGGRSAQTRFKAGGVPGNWVPVGSYRINSYGNLDRKVTDLGRGPRDWEPVSRIVWRQAYGQIPAGHAIVFKPGRHTTELAHITPDALECLSRAQLMVRNSAWAKGAELGRLYQLRGAITRQVNIIAKSQQQPQGTAA